MPKNTPVPSECRLAAPAPLAMISGATPRMKAKEVMRIGRNRSRAASSGGIEHARAPVPELVGEFDDQDRVLGREPDHRDQRRPGSRCRSRSRGARCPGRRRGCRTGCPGSPRRESTSSRTAPPAPGRRAPGRARRPVPPARSRRAPGYDWPLYAKPTPSGSYCSRSRRSTASSCWPELTPGGARRGDQRGGEAVEPAEDRRGRPEFRAGQRRERNHRVVLGPHVQPADVLRASGGSAPAPRPAPGRSARTG